MADTDFYLSDEQRELRRAVSEFTATEIARCSSFRKERALPSRKASGF